MTKVEFYAPGVGVVTGTPVATEYVRTFTFEEIAAKKARVARIAGFAYVVAVVAHGA
jgi:hypothetical protein